jgi:hypothetical protein
MRPSSAQFDTLSTRSCGGSWPRSPSNALLARLRYTSEGDDSRLEGMGPAGAPQARSMKKIVLIR